MAVPAPQRATARPRISAARPRISTSARGGELRRALGDERVALPDERAALARDRDDHLATDAERVRDRAAVADGHGPCTVTVADAEQQRVAGAPIAGQDDARQLVGAAGRGVEQL